MQTEFFPETINDAAKKFRRQRKAKYAIEIKVDMIREIPLEYENPLIIDDPNKVYAYWKQNVATRADYDWAKEHLVVLALNTRRHPICHNLVGIGTLDTIVTQPREIFRPLIAVAAAGFVMMHNHPSGDPTPSDADIKITRELYRAAQILKIEFCDHVIIGKPTFGRPSGFSSLKEMGCFA